MKQRDLHHDYETFCEIDLPKVGVSKYAKHPSCEVLMCSWAWDDDGPIKQWVPAEIGEPIPAELEDGLLDERVTKHAWNSQFERNIAKHVLGIDIPIPTWRDPMVLAFSLSLPGKLEKVGPIINLEGDNLKDSRGRALINKFTKPRKPTKTKKHLRADWVTDPEDWQDFLLYNRRDTGSERAAWRRLRRYGMPPWEWELWFADQEINEAGIPINMGMVNNALDLYHQLLAVRMRRLVEITGLDNPNSVAQLLPWLQGQGYSFDDLKAGHVRRAAAKVEAEIAAGMGGPRLERLLEALEIRVETAKTSVKKYDALAEVVDEEGLFRHAFQFAGAGRTWRWAGRKVQYHNAPRPPPYLEKSQEFVAQMVECLDAESFEIVFTSKVQDTGRGVVKRSPIDALATGVRPAVQAPDGWVFVDADLNAIENRVLGYMAQDKKILRVFENNLDPYVDFSTYMLGGTYEERWNEYKVLENKGPRTLSKPAVLGCGYQLGPGEEYENEKTGEIEATGLLGYAWNMGVTQFTKEQSVLAVRVWRETFEDCVEFWYRIEAAAKRCVRTGKRVDCWPVTFDRKGPFLRMILPSGRALHYVRPRLEERMMKWGKEKTVIVYDSLNDKNQWVPTPTSPGKLTENGDQAISRDLLAHGIMLARKEGLDVRLHVHDQIVAMIPERQANWGLATLLDCMKTRPDWAPYIPLGAAGAINKYFVKD